MHCIPFLVNFSNSSYSKCFIKLIRCKLLLREIFQNILRHASPQLENIMLSLFLQFLGWKFRFLSCFLSHFKLNTNWTYSTERAFLCSELQRDVAPNRHLLQRIVYEIYSIIEGILVGYIFDWELVPTRANNSNY